MGFLVGFYPYPTYARNDLDSSLPVAGIGLSGEAKSWALLLLLKQAVGKERVVAFTVDHKLKPDSTALAAKIHSKVTKLGETRRGIFSLQDVQLKFVQA